MIFPQIMAVFILKLSEAAEHRVGQNAIGYEKLSGYGKECGTSHVDPQLKCCIGVSLSTLIGADEECCNGLPVRQGQICCNWILPVNVTSPSHDSCCLDVEMATWTTFSRSLAFCDTETGTVRPIPSVFNLLTIPKFIPHDVNLLEPESGDSSEVFDNAPVPSESSSSLEELEAPASPHDESIGLTSTSASFLSSPLHLSSLRLSSAWGLCRPGPDDKKFANSRETYKCCGRQRYYASQQTCCVTTLYDIPTEEGVCCYDQAFHKNNTSNPCLRTCGSNSYMNTETHLCCQGVAHLSTSETDICCGSDVINSRDQLCCMGDTIALSKRGKHGCCHQRVPFHKQTMRCLKFGSLQKKNETINIARQVCRRQLPTWSNSWPQPVLVDKLTHFEGVVENVEVRSLNGQPSVHLTLKPYHIVHSALSHINNSSMSELEITLAIDDERNCLKKRQLQQYLEHKTLSVFAKFGNNDRMFPVQIPARSRNHLVLLSPESINK